MLRNSIILQSLVILLTTVLISGCARDERPQQETSAAPAAIVMPPPAPMAAPIPIPAPSATPIPPADLEARYQAALSITGVGERDIALAQVAQLAAASDDISTVRRALSAMSGAVAHDDAADAVAVTLASRGHRDQAIVIAQSITSSARRDATLAKLSAR